jgi:hypothetical protein
MTRDQVLAVARHGVSVAGGAAAAFGLMKAVDVQQLMTGLDHISQGIGEVLAVLGPMAAGLMAWISSWKTKDVAQTQALSVVAAIPATTIVTLPAIAAATPEQNIVSSDSHKVEPVKPAPFVPP